MINKELYRETFSKLHASDDLDLEELKMKSMRTKKGFRCSRSLAIAMVMLVAVFAMSCIVYAATDGQIVDSIKVWINGESVDAQAYQGEDGDIHVLMGEGDNVVVEREDQVTEYNCLDGQVSVHNNEDESEVEIKDSGTGN